MKNDIKIWLYTSLIVSVFALILIGCSKDEDPDPYTAEIPFNPNIVYDSIADIEGNVYKTVVIGTQTWIAENLKTTAYNDGNPIPKAEENSVWAGLTSPAYCWYNNDEATFKNTYGALYNYPAVAMEKICPAGWHVPSDVEWTTLEDYLIANGFNCDDTKTFNKISKSLASSVGWVPSVNEGSVGNTDYPAYINKTGFTALPAGYRSQTGLFLNIGNHANWWTSDGYSDTLAWARDIYTIRSVVDRYFGIKKNGASVRCVMD